MPMFRTPVPQSKTRLVAPVELPIVIVLAAAPVPIFILLESASLPILIIPALEFNSNTPSASNKSVSSELIVISPAPVEVSCMPAVPELITTFEAPVILPIVITLAAAAVPIFTAAVSTSVAKLSGVPAVFITALADAVNNPDESIVVPTIALNVPAAGVVPPIAGGDAKTEAKFDGVTSKANAPVDGVPATASAFVESCPIPATVSVATGAPAIARASA